MRNPLQDHGQESERPFGIRQWLGGYGWFAMGLLAVMTLVLRTSTVGAPAQASAPTLDDRPVANDWLERARSTSVPEELPRFRTQIAMEEELRLLRQELDQAKSALDVERERSQVLEASYYGLDAQFERVADLVREKAIDPDAQRAGSRFAPRPVEAIFVIEEGASPAPSAATSPSQ
ncbi:MAG: hypothetical protein AAGG01_15645 [Planctomycetota bacterium]